MARSEFTPAKRGRRPWPTMAVPIAAVASLGLLGVVLATPIETTRVNYGLSIPALFRSRSLYDKQLVVIHGRLRQLEHSVIVTDEACAAACLDAISYRVPDAIAARRDIRLLLDARMDNSRACFVRLLVKVIYKPPRPDAPWPPVGMRLRWVEVVKVLAVSTHPVDGPGRRRGRPCV